MIGTAYLPLAADPTIGDERAIHEHLTQAAAEQMSQQQLVAQGKSLFVARFTPQDGVGRPAATQAEIPTWREPGATPAFFRTSGPEANSCAGCHNQPIAGGGGDFVTNVFSSEGIDDAEFDTLDPQFSNERGTTHLFGSGLVELLAREMTNDLQRLRDKAVEDARTTQKTQRITLQTKGVQFGSLSVAADGFINVDDVEGVDFDLIVKPFSQKGVFSSLRQFTINAMNAHHGMQSVERYGSRWTGVEDFDEDGIPNELLTGDITALVAFQATLATPLQKLPEHKLQQEAAQAGQKNFVDAQCNSCHMLALPLKSLSFTEPNPVNGAGNLRISDVKTPIEIRLSSMGLNKNANGEWLIPLFSDLKRHTIADNENNHFANELLGQRFIPRDVFLTPRLWGVGDSAPYGHRGDVTTLREAILHHGGEAAASRQMFANMPAQRQAEIIEFLKSLKFSTGVQG